MPAINLGRRQQGRMRATNVINEEFDSLKIQKAIETAMSEAFRSQNLAECVNPYGDGHSAERIIQVIRESLVNDMLLSKNLTY